MALRRRPLISRDGLDWTLGSVPGRAVDGWKPLAGQACNVLERWRHWNTVGGQWLEANEANVPTSMKPSSLCWFIACGFPQGLCRESATAAGAAGA